MQTRVCKKPGCGRTAEEGKKYCTRHAALEQQDQKRKIFTQRTKSNEWHSMYNDREWRARSSAFLKKYPVCCICGKPSRITDHIKPHRGDRVLFWDESNWQPLCWSCHSRKTLQENKNFKR